MPLFDLGHDLAHALHVVAESVLKKIPTGKI
jgi:hypothetical protein